MRILIIVCLFVLLMGSHGLTQQPAASCEDQRDNLILRYQLSVSIREQLEGQVVDLISQNRKLTRRVEELEKKK